MPSIRVLQNRPRAAIFSAVLLLGSCFANAAPAQALTSLTACINNKNQKVRFPEVGKSCKSGETAILLSGAGPTGATGPTGPTGPAGLAGPLITPATQCILYSDVTGIHDQDTQLCGWDFGAALPAGQYVVVMTGEVAVTIGATAPATLGIDVVDAGGHDLFGWEPSWVPDALLVPNTTISFGISATDNFTVTSDQAPTAFPGPACQVYPVAEDVTVKEHSECTFQIFQTTEGY